MLVANVIAILVVLGCAVYQYQKGSLVQSFATLVISICATAAAFGYFEVVTGLLVGSGDESRIGGLTPWASSLSFAMIFVVLFAVLQTAIGQVQRKAVDLGVIAERAGRIIFGLLMGLVCSGVLITTLIMAPLSAKYPYPRFDDAKVNIESPTTVMLNVDGFATGWGNLLSAGSFSGKTSLAALHPRFLDQMYLNRLGVADHVSLMTASDGIELPPKGEDGKIAAVWVADEGIKDSAGKAIGLKSGHRLTIVRVGFTRKSIADSGRFTLSQVRLICRAKTDTANVLVGTAQDAYAIGYVTAENQLEVGRLNEVVQLKSSDFVPKTNVRWMDFGFYVPNDSAAVLLGFKQNVILELPPPIATDEAPAAVPFEGKSGKKEPDDEPKKKRPGKKSSR
jgi:hypothetical protein